MKLSSLALLLTVVVGFSNASYLPGLVIQEDVGIYIGESTKLITNCGDAKDILT